MFSSEDEETYKTGKISPFCIRHQSSVVVDYLNSLLSEHDANQSIPESPRIETSEEKDLVIELESARLQRLMTLLQGVPPPPSVTIPQISLTEVLKKLRDNIDELVGPSDNGGMINKKIILKKL